MSMKQYITEIDYTAVVTKNIVCGLHMALKIYLIYIKFQRK